MFHQPRSIEEALQLKQHLGTDASFLAGGTDLIVMSNAGRSAAKAYIDLTHVPGLDSISEPESSSPSGKSFYRASGGATFSRLARLPVRVLAEAALSVGGPQIRNRATIAGNLATASPAGDGSTALLALDAELTLRNISARRRVPLRDFFLDYRKTALAPDEIVDSVTFPAGWRTAWVKLGKRGAMNISVVCCAIGLSEAGEFHIAFGSVGPCPLRTPETARFLTESVRERSCPETASLPHLTSDVVEEACDMVSREVRPIDDFRATAEYRRAMAASLLRKGLRQLAPS